MLEGEEMVANVRKIVKHENKLMKQKQEYDNRIRLERISFKEDFIATFKNITETDKRVPLIISTPE